MVEPDIAGAGLGERLARSPLRDRLRLVGLDPHKDPSALHLAAPEAFKSSWSAALAAAVPVAEVDRVRAAEASEAAWKACAHLARERDILSRVAAAAEALGVAGEARAVKLIYLVIVGRYLDRPPSAIVKGPSSGGKSYLLERMLRLFPEDAYHKLTAVSDKVLAYSEEPLAHRVLVVQEVAGAAGDTATYLLRSLLSEGHIRYETLEKTDDGVRARQIERAGPTGLIVTTTAPRWHPENETRMLSIPVTDTREQTKAILRALTGRRDAEPDLGEWHALQVWLGGAEHRVVIPYDEALADLTQPVALRLRRDFGLVLNLIRAHALLHQATRERDDAGRVVATLANYAAVRSLVADLIEEGAGASVPQTVKETAAAVGQLTAASGEGRDNEAGHLPTTTVAAVADALKLDKSSALRRVRVALDLGYLRDEETGRGRPRKLALGDPLPADVAILPEPDSLAVAAGLRACTVPGGHEPPHPSPSWSSGGALPTD